MKRGLKQIALVLIAFSVMFLLFFSAAALTDETSQIKKSYSWLESKAIGKWQNLNTGQLVFSLLALKDKITGNQTNTAIKALIDKSSENGTCWPASSCNGIETAQAKIALDLTTNTLGKNSAKASAWLLSHTRTPDLSNSNISWYLQITPNNYASCLLMYNGSSNNIAVDETGVMEGNFGSCFEITEDKYRLKLNPGCGDYVYNVTCNDSVIINFLFQKNSNTSVWYVVGQSSSSNQQEVASIKLLNKCFSLNNVCDYEATLWAAYAFDLPGSKEIARTFIPYLIIGEDDIQGKYMTDAFLYKLTGRDDYAVKVSNLQGSNYLFLAPESTNAYYDTSIAFMTKASIYANETNAHDQLLLQQKRDGSWLCDGTKCDSVRDTAMILYSIWPGYEWRTACGLAGFDCVSNCTGLGNSIAEDCADENLDCCNISYTCEVKFGLCKPSCLDNEAQTSYSCGSGVCCKSLNAAKCVSEIGGQICSGNQKCLNAQNIIIPFIYSGGDPSDMCCKGGICNTPAQTCQDSNGVYCDPAEGNTCEQGKWLQAVDTTFCCQQGFCSQQPQTCFQLRGEICSDSEDCKNGVYVNSSDSLRCCAQGGRCIPETCQYNSCENNENCVGGESFETSDALVCCNGNCLKSCSALNGTPCDVAAKCTGRLSASSDVTRCCIGKCQAKSTGKFPTKILIIAVVLVVAIIILAVLIKKARKKKSNPSSDLSSLYGFGIPPPSNAGTQKMRRPGFQPKPLPRQMAPILMRPAKNLKPKSDKKLPIVPVPTPKK